MHSPTLLLSIFLSNLILPSFNPDAPTLKITIIRFPPSCQNRPLVSSMHMAREHSHPQKQQNPHHKVTSPELFQVDYRGDLLPIIAPRFAGINSYLGITELVDDMFHVMGILHSVLSLLSNMLELGPPFLPGIGWIPWRPRVLRLYTGQRFAAGFFRNRGGIAKHLVRMRAARLDALRLLSCHKVVSREFELTKDITRLEAAAANV